MNAPTKTLPLGANGVMPLLLTFPFARARLDVIGGPFDKFKRQDDRDYGVCVRSERPPGTQHVHLAIDDFSVPSADQREAVDEAIKQTFRALLAGKRVWVGCAGGFGRTGLFLALLAKVAGVPAIEGVNGDPVAFVRRTYYPHAVETGDQIRYVRNLDVANLRSWLTWYSWGHFWRNVFTWWA